ncbi:peptidylprolyl isomerase [Candidatus Uabimicrobium amorphum]|uniref:peptidylprolyl isomerase n=1 Tax=Uabimicrobium amorphum TaxID=2596890 RepID=A0A5S9IL68_UABAM|nr:peptidylprolyl isomerase [Candidatus Uabimicrobium amorphum]BBM83571.1 foldase protein PrsA [Candidatus Uabimicrobium amorphum]
MYKKYVVALVIFMCSVWAEDVPKVVASIDSLKISRHELAELLNDRYQLLEGKVKRDKSAEYEVINSLQKRVVLAALEELITLRLTKSKLTKLKVKCVPKEYVEEAKRAEKPFFTMYAKWGLSNPISFLDSLSKILKGDKKLNDKYGPAVKNLSLKFRLSVEDRKEILKIWSAVEKSSLHGKARMHVFKHHSITMKNFKTRVKVNAMLRKYIIQNKSNKDIQEIMDKESFPLSGGIIRLSHILFFTIDPVSKKELPAEEQKKLYQKMIKMKKKIVSGGNFEKMAEKYSDDETTKYKNGDLGFVPRWGMFAKEIIEVAYKSKKDEIKGPIKTEFGYHLIKVTDVKKGKDLPTSELREKAIERYVAMKKEKILKKWYGDAKITRFFR